MNKTTLTGKIESFRFTSGSFGEQYVTIDGVRYMSFWEIKQLKRGATVEFEVSEPRQNCFVGSSQVVFKEKEAHFVRFVDGNASK